MFWPSGRRGLLAVTITVMQGKCNEILSIKLCEQYERAYRVVLAVLETAQTVFSVGASGPAKADSMAE